MKYALVIMCFLVQGCSVNYFLYSPNDITHYRKSDFSHRVDDVYLRSGSGNILHTQYHYSAQQSGLIVHFHGNRGNLSQTVEKVLWLVERGYDLLLVDYSGYGQSTGRATTDNLRLDSSAVLTYASQLPIKNKIIISTSMGGAIAIDGLSDSGLATAFDLLVIDSSFDSYQSLAKNVVSNLPFANWLSNLIPNFLSDDRAPKSLIGSFSQIPILIAHCESDGLIPIERSEALFKYSPEDTQFWRFEDCRHARTFTNEHPYNQTRLLSFIEYKIAARQQYSLLVGSYEEYSGHPD